MPKGKKRLTQREKAERAAIKKQLQADGVLPPDKPRLNRKKFAREVWDEFSEMDVYTADFYLRKAIMATVGPELHEVTSEQVGILKLMKLAVETDRFMRQLKTEGREQYSIGEYVEKVYNPVMNLRRIHIMAKLTPDATRTEHGLVINEKIIPWGAVWPKDSGAYKKGAQYKADRLLSGGTGKVKGVTIHNTNDLKNVEEDAEQYTRATWPNANMNDARVHYYVDDINAWQNLREDEVGWHAGDGRKATGGNETTLSIEIIMDGSGSKEDRKAEENGVLLAALLLKKHGLSVNELYTHNHWMGHPDSIVQGARKNCPLYILPHWAQFKQKVAAKLTELNGGATTTEAGKTEIMGKAKASAQQMALFARSKNAEPQLPACSLEQLAQFFLEEGEAEGVRGDVAFAQSLHETGFFKYGGIVLPTQNNYAGIGALNGNAKGQAATFPDPRTGVRAQIQHLKAYASKEMLVNGCVDPRFSLVTRGSAQYVEWLGASDNPNGKGWAVPGKGYGGKIVALLGQIMAFEVPQPSAPSEPEEQEPEFPAYQLEGLETLTEAGVINSPEFWRQKFSEQVTVGEMFGILGKLFTKVTE